MTPRTDRPRFPKMAASQQRRRDREKLARDRARGDREHTGWSGIKVDTPNGAMFIDSLDSAIKLSTLTTKSHRLAR